MAITIYELVGSDPARPFSPHCWKVVMALAHKQLQWKSVPTPFTSVANTEGGFHPTIPVLRDKDHLVGDSFEIARYLEAAYPEAPSLFGGAGGEATARFVERWTQNTLHPYLGRAALMDIHDRLAPADQDHFRRTREPRFGKRLEEVPGGRDEGLAAFRNSLVPLRDMLSFQPFIGGETPLFHDYIVFGALQWVRVVSPFRFLDDTDPVAAWFERCLDLHDGIGRAVPAAA